MKRNELLTLVACLAAQLAAVPAWSQSKSEIQAMDNNNDGIVTRAEWTGERGAFRLHDTNKDGTLSGTEVWDDATARRRTRPNRQFSDWTAERFTAIDRNKDGRIAVDEWQFARSIFDTADANRDSALSRREFLNQAPAAAAPTATRGDAFRDLDHDGNGVIAGNEWPASDAEFRALDVNRDGVIRRNEFRETAGTSGVVEQSNAYRLGYQRGLIEGREAGRGDRARNQGWDLEGQRELESADSGYQTNVGSKADYQEGYRAGFRFAYAEGFAPR